MGSRHDAKRMNEEGDRLSSLPDDLIHKILSFISLQQGIETSALLSRWRYIWTSMPYLNFSTESFSKLNKFSKFVTNILSRRDNRVQLPFVKLCFHGKATQVFVKRILNYAFSHNIEQLTCSSGYKSCTLASTWDLPALTTLCLSRIKLDVDLSSNCPNLKNLTIIRLPKESGKSDLNICLPKLSNLTLEYVSCNVVNVEAPQLKNLKMRESYSSVNFFADVFSLEEVDLTICYPHKAQTVVGLLQQFSSVKFLTLNLEIVEEIRAYKLMEELQKLLNCWITNSDKNTAQVDQREVENHRAHQETMIESQYGERAKMQPMYSCLHAEAETFIDNMMDRVRIHCDKKPRCSNIQCHELATPSQPFP
ncbi:F-box domain containing protein [Tanacetum coccineum]